MPSTNQSCDDRTDTSTEKLTTGALTLTRGAVKQRLYLGLLVLLSGRLWLFRDIFSDSRTEICDLCNVTKQRLQRRAGDAPQQACLSLSASLNAQRQRG